MTEQVKKTKFFLPYQMRWLNDNSKVKIWEKSRRIGATYVQSYEDVRDCVKRIVPAVWFSSADESAAREYIDYCKQWATLFNIAAKDLGEQVLDKEKDIKAYVIQFSNGTKIHALSSNPKGFRSKGGKVVLDEFAYQKQYNTEHAMMQRLKNMSQVIGIQLGEALAPAFGKVLDFGESTLNMLDKMSPQMKSFVAISIAGLGILATSFGIACLMGSKLLKFYGGFLSRARELTPVLVQNSASILESMGLKTTAQNLTLGYNLKGGANIGSGLFSDIKRIDNNLRKGIVTGFKEFPSNVSKSAIALKDWTVTSVKAIPTNFVNGLKAFKTGFLNIPNLIKNAVIAFRTFSITLLTSPLGWIAVAIGVVALVIYKYWKPIAGFFKGLWQGLVEGLKPLMPLFKQIGTAIEPILKPIKAVFNWFKKLIQPVEDTGGKAEAMGVRVGKAIAGIIVKLTELVAKAFECGRKITSMLAEGIMSGLAKVKNCIVKVAQVIRDHLPHSPAKTGPLKDLNKVKIVETIASTIKPMPLKNAMTKTLSFMTNGTLNVSKGKIGTSSGASFVVQYNPTITISGTESKEEFVKLLKRHKDEVVNIMKREFERKERLAY